MRRLRATCVCPETQLALIFCPECTRTQTALRMAAKKKGQAPKKKKIKVKKTISKASAGGELATGALSHPRGHAR